MVYCDFLAGTLEELERRRMHEEDLLSRSVPVRCMAYSQIVHELERSRMFLEDCLQQYDRQASRLHWHEHGRDWVSSVGSGMLQREDLPIFSLPGSVLKLDVQLQCVRCWKRRARM